MMGRWETLQLKFRVSHASAYGLNQQQEFKMMNDLMIDRLHDRFDPFDPVGE